jgi:uncharacterized protein (DUF1330 family)
MAQAYWIAHVTITNPELYQEYAKRAPAALAAYGGVFLARGGRYAQLEGKEHPRNVVAIFPSFEAAVECYHSAAYQEAAAFGKVAAERNIMVVEALD